MNLWIKNPIGLLFIILFLMIVFYHCSALPNGTETIITTDAVGSRQQAPAIYDDQIVWEDSRAGNWDIFYYNLSSGEEIPITTDTGDHHRPAIHGNYVVYENGSSPNIDIWMYNISNGTAVPITIEGQDQTNPKMYGDIIVWQDHQNPDWDINYFNLSSGTETFLVYPNDQTTPDVYGDKIIWQDYDGGVTYTIPVYNLTSQNIENTITTTSSDNIAPVIYSNYVVWQDCDGSTWYYHINMTDLNDPSTTIQITPDSIVGLSEQKNPAIYGNYVVAEDYRSGATPDIYLYDIANLNDITEKLITPDTDGSFQIVPAMYGNRIVWEDWRNGGGTDSDIYMLTLGAAETCPVADFTASPAGGASGISVTLTDVSRSGSSPITHRVWNFSDGSAWATDPVPPVTHPFNQDGIFPVKLMVSNQKCRNVSTGVCSHSIFVNRAPVAGFTATPEYGFAPLTVHFTDTSCGVPTSWSWTFGDGNTSTLKNPTDTFYSNGENFTVTLTAGNVQGSSTATKYLRTLMGAQSTATIPIDGITVDNRFNGSFLTYNGSVLSSFQPPVPTAYIMTVPPPRYGWMNITFVSSDAVGFVKESTNNTYFANISRLYFRTNDTVAAATGDPPSIGNGWGVNYQMNTTHYPTLALVKTEIWEGSIPDDLNAFTLIAAYNKTTLRDVAYTAKFTKQNISSDWNATLNMSVSTSWVAGSGGVATGRNYTFIIGYGYDSNGDKIGTVLNTNYRFTNGTLDYFEADIPPHLDYFTTFALAKLSGSGNVFQMVYLAVAQHFDFGVQSSSDTSEGPVGGTGQGLTSQQDQPLAPAPEPPVAPEAKSVELLINEQAVVTQTTILQSPDQLAALSIGQGVVAKDSAENPLSSVTIASASMSASGIPESLQGSTFSFAGIAYNLQPDGATFSPAATITFTVPQAQWSQHYMVKEWDPLAGVWVDLPTTYHPESGTISASVSHFCIIALFSDTIKPSQTPSPTVVQTPLPTIAPPQPTSPFGVFYGMVAWFADLFMKNMYLFLIVAAIIVAFYANRRRKGRDPLRFK